MAKHPSLIGLTLIVGLLLAFSTSAAAQFLSWDDFLEQLYMEAEALLAKHVVEPDGTSLELRILDTELRHTLLDESTELTYL